MYWIVPVLHRKLHRELHILHRVFGDMHWRLFRLLRYLHRKLHGAMH